MTTTHPRDLLPGVELLRPFGETTRIDLTQPPYNADPSGQRDSTQALVKALDALVTVTAEAMAATIEEIEALPGDGHLPSGVENRKQNGKVIGIFPSYLPYLPVLYLPPGEYLVSDSITYTRSDLANSLGSELNRQIRIVGAGRDRSVIRLVDSAPAFAGTEPKPVLSLMSGRRSNVAMSNYVEDLSIVVGAGNPAAVGLDFYASNTGAVRNVRIVDEGKSAHTGLAIVRGSPTGILIDHVSIEGFAVGIDVIGYVVGEHLQLRGQRDCGVRAGNGYLSLRDLDFDAAAPALRCSEPAGQVSLIDSRLQGSGPVAIDYSAGVLYCSQVATRGFQAPMAEHDDHVDADIDSSDDGATLRELVLPHPVRIPGTGPVMQRLPVEEMPAFTERSGERHCGVRAFGAVGDGHHDDSAAIQAALDSGAAIVEFEAGHYRMEAPVRIPASVRRIHFSYCDLVAGEGLAEMRGQGAFVIAENSDEPLFLEKLFAWELWRGEHHTFEHACRRTVVIRDIHAQLSPLYANSVRGSKVFIDNICCTTGVVPGTSGHGRACVDFRGQQVWCRQLNPERGEPMARNAGGTLWVLGCKTEDAGVSYETTDGGRTELVGGNLFSGRPHSVAFRVVDAELRCTASTSGGVPEGYHGTAIEETRDGATQRLEAGRFPLRGVAEHCGPQYHIPLYCSPVLPPPA